MSEEILIDVDDLHLGKDILIDVKTKTITINAKTTMSAVNSFMLEEWKQSLEFIKFKIPISWAEDYNNMANNFNDDWTIINIENIVEYGSPFDS